MTSADMITDFVIRRDSYKTPMGSFADYERARQACPGQNIDQYHVVEMSTVQSLLKAVNACCGNLAEEYDFSLDC